MLTPKEFIDGFEEEHGIEEVILLGKNGAIRRLILTEEESEEKWNQHQNIL